MWSVLTPCGETFQCSGSMLHSDGGVRSLCPMCGGDNTSLTFHLWHKRVKRSLGDELNLSCISHTF